MTESTCGRIRKPRGSRRTARLSRPDVTTSVLATLLICFVGLAQAQFGLRGEVLVGTDVSVLSSGGRLSEVAGLELSAHLEAELSLDPVQVIAVLDPVLAAASYREAVLEPGLSEVYALYRARNLDLSAGIERLALETARLSLPYSVDGVSELGRVYGYPGLRLTSYLGDWRLRAAARYRAERLTPVISVRRSFPSFELEAHGLYSLYPVVGLSGSGLLGDLVVYGESWLLAAAEPDLRGALGLSGFWGDRLWTLEAALAPAFGMAADPAFPQLNMQLSWPLETASLQFTAGTAYPTDPVSGAAMLVGLAAVDYVVSATEAEVVTGLNVFHADGQTVYSSHLRVRSFF